MKRIREEEIFPRNPNKTYGLMELVKGSSTRVDRGPDDMVSSWPHLLIREAALFAACLAGDAGAVRVRAAAAGTAGQPAASTEPGQSALVLPGLAGAGRL